MVSIKRLAGGLALAFLLSLTMASAAFADHVRPKGATPERDSLVIAYRSCANPDSVHGAPLTYRSCHPPVQASPWLTAGTPDSNGLPTNFVGSTRLDVCLAPTGCGAPFPTGEDIKIEISLTDVRCTGALASATPSVCPAGALGAYTGSVRAIFPLQITDHCNRPAPTAQPVATCPPPPGLSATGPPGLYALPFPVDAGCAPVSAGGGSTCATTTTFNALVPGSIVAGQRANIEVGIVTVFDGGKDGDATTLGDQDSEYADQGVFAP
jgi:hypothetical protein